MSTELLDIKPQELRFVVEAKKQSSCTIQLANKFHKDVAFKVKTTSPKKYCVYPNVGIIKPNGTCDFTVTMQVQRAAPLDLQCKDKFLIQSTVVVSGTSEEDITSDLFVKDSGKIVDERKLRVILVFSPPPPLLVPGTGVANQDSLSDTSQKEKVASGVESLPSSPKEPEGTKISRPTEDLFTNAADTLLAEGSHELAMAKMVESRELKTVDEGKFPKTEMKDLLRKEYEDYKSKIDVLESKLAEAEKTAAKLTEERSKALQEKQLVKRELALIKRRFGGKTVHMGFPLLYVCMVALICLMLGYMMQ